MSCCPVNLGVEEECFLRTPLKAFASRTQGRRYLSKVTQLFRSIEELQQDTRNVDEVSEKILALEEAFGRFQRAHFEYVATLRDDP